MCYAKPGNRCSGFRSFRHSTTVEQRETAEAALTATEQAIATAEQELTAAENHPGTLPASLPRRRAQLERLRAELDTKRSALHVAQVKEQEAQTAWLETPSGIAHLEQQAADPSLTEVERAKARVAAEQNKAKHEAELDARWAARRTDTALQEELTALKVPKATREAIAAMKPGTPYGELAVMPQAKATAFYTRATEELDEAKVEAAHQLKKAETALLERHRESLVKYQARGQAALQAAVHHLKIHDPAYRARFDQLNAELEPARAAHRNAKAQWQCTPEGEKSLETELRTHQLALRPEAIRTQREELTAAATRGRLAANEKFGRQIRASKGTAREQEVLNAYRSALAPHTPEAVEAKLAQHVDKTDLAVHRTRVRIAQVKHLREEEARGTVLRNTREQAIRQAVLDAGHSQTAVEKVLTTYRAAPPEPQPGQSRKGPARHLEPEHLKSGTYTMKVTPDEKAQLKAEAAAEGKPLHQLVRERLAVPPQEGFTSESIQELHADFQLYRNGRPHRPRTVGDGPNRWESIVISASPAFRELRRQQADAFDNTMSSDGRAAVLGIDRRQVQNDRSEKSRNKKKIHMEESHATAEQSRANTPA